MKYNTQILLIYLAAGVLACQSIQKEIPKVVEPPVIVKPEPIPTPPKETISLDKIKSVAATSACAKYEWNERGLMPKAFIKGMAIAYARSLCNKERSDIKVVSSVPSGDLKNDVLSHYKFQTTVGIESMRKTYQLLFGLAMWESSGKHCCGKDGSQNFDKADEAEAGAFQTSYGARSHSEELTKLFKIYSADKSKCYLDVFSEGVSCTKNDAKSWGSGDGAKFQELSKSCPMFSVEYAAVLSRVYGGSLGEFSTYRRKEAEVRPECEDLLKQIEKLVESSPDICKII